MNRIACLVFVIVAACGGSSAGPDSKAVGGTCTSNSDCDGMCLTNPTFPRGYCTRACTSDKDCADGSRCVIDDFGQICEVLCTTVANCTDFGSGFACDQKALVEGSGSVGVCRSH